MKTYVILLRGINVGGKNKVPMAALKSFLEEQGCGEARTYIQSGNAVVRSALGAKALAACIEKGLPKAFKLDSALIRVLVLTKKQVQAIVDKRPKGFGGQPTKFHSDVIFLMGIDPAETLLGFVPRDGVDKVWPGPGVIYAQRLSAQRTKSRLNKLISTPAYQSMTIRNWNTTTKLLAMLAE
jgi:uncharacterized protein (DUF1697 family)